MRLTYFSSRLTRLRLSLSSHLQRKIRRTAEQLGIYPLSRPQLELSLLRLQHSSGSLPATLRIRNRSEHAITGGRVSVVDTSAFGIGLPDIDPELPELPERRYRGAFSMRRFESLPQAADMDLGYGLGRVPKPAVMPIVELPAVALRSIRPFAQAHFSFLVRRRSLASTDALILRVDLEAEPAWLRGPYFVRPATEEELLRRLPRKTRKLIASQFPR